MQDRPETAKAPQNPQSAAGEMRVWTWGILSESGREAWLLLYAYKLLTVTASPVPHELGESMLAKFKIWYEEMERDAEEGRDPPHSRPEEHRGIDSAKYSTLPPGVLLSSSELQQYLPLWRDLSEVQREAMTYRMAISFLWQLPPEQVLPIDLLSRTLRALSVPAGSISLSSTDNPP